MFKAPFSFDGRVRRMEFGLSRIIYVILFYAVIFLIISSELFFLAILFIPTFWFAIAQGAKRCHDLGNSGWFQLIPFYGLWMLFQDGQSGQNEYGMNPKGIGNEDGYDDQINEIGKSLES